MKKRSLSLFVALCLLFALLPQVCLPVFAETYSGTCSNQLTWTLDPSTGILTVSGEGALEPWSTPEEAWGGHMSEVKALVIGDGVTAVYSNAFFGYTNLTELTIGKDVRTIHDYAFAETGLKELTIPGNVESLYNSAFRDCTALASLTLCEGLEYLGENIFSGAPLTSVTLPDSLQILGSNVFRDCTLLSEVDFGKGVSTIFHSAFYGCTALKEISIPGNVKHIYSSAFAHCTALERATISSGVESIRVLAFDGCTSLTSINFPDSVTLIEECVLRNTAYYNDKNNWIDGVLFLDNHLIQADTSLSGSYIVPSHVINIAMDAFAFCQHLTSVTLPQGLTTIHEETFNACHELTSIAIPHGVTSIYWSAFFQCYKLTDLYLPHSVTFIDEAAFYCCDNLTNIYYSGSERMWNMIDIEEYGNDPLRNATLHTTEPILDPNLTIRHTLDLVSDISLNYAVSASRLAAYDSFLMECTVPVYENNVQTGTELITIQPELRGSYYYFPLTGVTAVQMGDKIEATLYLLKNNVPYVSVTDVYSIADYVYSQFPRPGISDPLKTLCANLLVYGAAAQTYKGYRTDALVSADMTEEQKSYCTDLETVTFGNNDEILNDCQTSRFAWRGKSLNLDTKVTLKLFFDVDTFYIPNVEDLTLRVTYVDVDGELQTRIITDPYAAEYYSPSFFELDFLAAGELRTVLEAAVFQGDKQISPTLRYSADTYGNGKYDTLLTLCQALFAYSDSARAFFVN